MQIHGFPVRMHASSCWGMRDDAYRARWTRLTVNMLENYGHQQTPVANAFREGCARILLVMNQARYSDHIHGWTYDKEGAA